MTRLEEIKARARAASLNCDHDTVGDLDWALGEIERLEAGIESGFMNGAYARREVEIAVEALERILDEAGTSTLTHKIAREALARIRSENNEKENKK